MVFALDEGVLQPRANSMPAAEKFARAGYDVAALLEPR
jgi:pilus assembly protein CpaF